ncbi:MAG: AAA family ATPase [Candidatus Syntrophoarchaeum sp. WYZ-LMO15]|nr:MAG: AAA family ATPase [Candidatus Syntrophoarchaeum sp. WYZ-LMO15]
MWRGSSLSEIWIEKYRPRSFDEVVGQRAVVERFRSYVKRGSIPNLLLHGRAGVGKSTLVYLLAKGLYGEGFEDNLVEIDASDFFNRGKAYLEAEDRFEHFYDKNKPVIETFKEVINEYASLMPIGADFKVIFFRNADALTFEAQHALRRMIERYNRTCRFLFTTRRPSRIIPPLRSRALNLYLAPIRDGLIMRRLGEILAAEGVKIDEELIHEVVSRAGGSMGDAIYALQYLALTGELPSLSDERIDELISAGMRGDSVRVSRLIEELLVDEGLTGEEVLGMIHEVLVSGRASLGIRIEEVVLTMADFDMRLLEGANEKIQLEALLSNITEV